nr:hypothetical protein [Tanacetum cinerariifolium]
ILSGPYKPTTILVQAVEATDDSPAVPKHTTILTGIGDEIYSTVDAYQIAQEIWEAINRLAREANPLALVSTAQANQDPYYPTSRSHKSNAPSSKPSIPTRSHTNTRYKGKEIAKPITPPFETTSEEDNDPKQAQRDKDMQKNLALIAKKPKRVKDSAYYKEKMLLCKQAEQVETDDSNVIPYSPDMCEDAIQNDQNDVKSNDERFALPNLISNLNLDVDENKKIQKQLQKANTTLAQELKECKT